MLAARLVEWIAPIVKQAGKTLWIVVDGGYTKAPFLKRAIAAGVTIVGRLRKDAALARSASEAAARPASRSRSSAQVRQEQDQPGQAGRPQQGWEKVTCTVYGQDVTKTYKTFLATYRPAGGVIRVVMLQEDHGWFAFFCTDPGASRQEIIEAFADRATIEQDFHDVKEVWGAGQQQVRNIWTNVAVYQLEPVDAYAGGTVGLEPHARGTLRSQRLAVGRRRSSSLSRESPQSLAATDHGHGIIERSPPSGGCREKSSD